ncbi:MAG: AAA family ATPase [Halioglobus sp.]|nr:AAA family ATPase [Halioglobus sp.]
MYYQYFGLTEAPFSIAVNPRYLFMSARHRDALAHLLYGVGAGGGFILLTGEVGTGKTTINRCVLEQLPQDTDIAIILNPALNAIELLASACDELRIAYDHDNHTLKTLTDNLQRFLLENHARGRKTVLLIDEAQHLDFDVLEQIRLLTNLETNSEKLLQIILIGQPELAQMLARPELRQLNQRITARYNLGPLNLDETGAYIQHRLQVAGMIPGRLIFPPSVVRSIYKATQGIPRVINLLCDRMLLGAYGRNESSVNHAMLRLAMQEVLGDETVVTPLWRWLGVAAVLLLVIWTAGWLLGKYTGGNAMLTPSWMDSQLEPDAIELSGQNPIPDDLVALEAEPVADTSLDASPPDRLNAINAMQAPRVAMAELWALYSVEPAPDEICMNAAQTRLACLEGEVWTWDELNAFNSPLLLEMITPQRFTAEVLLLGMDEPMAWVLVEGAVVSVPLAELAPYWTGRYRLLWHPPVGFEKSLVLGDNSAVVALVAQLFARLDGQPTPLTGRRFNRALEQRVRLFQQQNGLVDDGVAGVQTLLKLNEQLAIDVTAAQARQRLQAAAGNGLTQ